MPLPLPATLALRCRNSLKGLSDLLILKRSILAISAICSTIIFALTVHFGKTTTFPVSDQRLGFQDNPEKRGTLNIIYTCLTTIFASVFVALHVDLGTTKITAKMGLVLRFTLIPELMLNLSAQQFAEARKNKAEMRGVSNGQWTTKHAFFENMGGFVLDDGDKFSYQWLRGHADEVHYKKLLDEIDDRSKKDIVAKTLACFQIGFILVQTIARKVQSLGITPLELMTCGYIVVALVTYAFWWSKPYDVHQTVVVRSKCAGAQELPRDSDSLHSTAPTIFTYDYPPELHSSLKGKIVAFSFTLAGVAFGGIHCLAWNTTFAITSGQILWRVCSCVLTVIPVLYSVAVFAMTHCSVHIRFINLNAVVASLATPYIIARICIFYLVVGYSFQSLPASAYEQVKWTTFLPQFN